ALHRARRPMARLFRKRATMRTGPVFCAAAALYQERFAMSASAQPPASPARFSTQELDMLARTADALTAYLGKPVLAEVLQGDQGTEWVTFDVPVAQGAPDEDQLHGQLGHHHTALLGTRLALEHDYD